jgi:superfamily II DNA or RNA helicase
MSLDGSGVNGYGHAVQLRPYQQDLLDLIWVRVLARRAVLAILPTGAGKTVIFSRLLSEYQYAAVAVAHRKELVSQISRSLAAEGVPHRIIAPRATIKQIAASNARAFGRSFVDPVARIGVAGVDSMKQACPKWAKSVRMYIQDEGHHPLEGNKWGKAVRLFPDATVVGLTATGCRGDGKGLGVTSDGIYEEMIFGPSMRELIDAGYLSEYRLFAPESAQLDLSAVPTSPATGDYSAPKLRSTMRAAKITGDVVRHYMDHAAGRLGVTFVTDVEAAEEMAQAYRDAGVPAAALSANTPAPERADLIRKFARHELHQLVNVDLFGEGFDLASASGVDVRIEVVSMARPTKSFGVYAQQFGRAIRPGHVAVVIDHVGNTVCHNGPPDFPRVFSLDPRGKRRSGGADDVPLVRVCQGCTGVYPRERSTCPYCGHVHVTGDRSSPASCDGNLIELEPAALAELRAVAERAIWDDETAREHYTAQRIPAIGVAANVKRQRETREAQDVLRDRIADVSGQWRASGADDAQIYRRFFLTYGIDVLSACGLKAKEATALAERMNDDG